MINSRYEAYIVSKEELESKQRLELSDETNSMKLISFVPNTETIVIVFENDTLEIQQSDSCPKNRYPIRDRNKQMKNAGSCEVGDTNDDPCGIMKDFSRGLINSMCFTSDGKFMCLTTVDQYIIILSTSTFDITNIVQITDSSIRTAVLMNSCKGLIVFGVTMKGAVIMVDVNESKVKGILVEDGIIKIGISKDNKMIFVMMNAGEIEVYLTSTVINYLTQMEQNVEKMMKDQRQERVKGRDIDPNVSSFCYLKKISYR